MTTSRILCGAVLLLAAGGPAAAQYRSDAPPADLPPGRPSAASAPTALDRVSAPGGAAPDPYGTLTGQAPGLPAGAYPSPYFTDGPGCCGPLGRHGRVGYEIFAFTGPAFIFGDGPFADLRVGWATGGGGRSLFFNPAHDAAYVAEIGLSYAYNGGPQNRFLNIFVRQPPTQDPFTGQQVASPDALTTVAIRGLHRTNFNFALGRDWWANGPGSVGLAEGWNLRCGVLVGGRWGTAHVDLIPQDDPRNGYARRQNVTHGVFGAVHVGAEVPLGSTVLFGGLRGEYGYDWNNLIPPFQGNINGYQLQLTAGLRF
ncbi:MAG: hypothetical protein C0501_05540 [Isosphaera sp.]|nr:hypothetical protein [Isosphaera sp.]